MHAVFQAIPKSSTAAAATDPATMAMLCALKPPRLPPELSLASVLPAKTSPDPTDLPFVGAGLDMPADADNVCAAVGVATGIIALVTVMPDETAAKVGLGVETEESILGPLNTVGAAGAGAAAAALAGASAGVAGAGAGAEFSPEVEP